MGQCRLPQSLHAGSIVGCAGVVPGQRSVARSVGRSRCRAALTPKTRTALSAACADRAVNRRDCLAVVAPTGADGEPLTRDRLEDPLRSLWGRPGRSDGALTARRPARVPASRMADTRVVCDCALRMGGRSLSVASDVVARPVQDAARSVETRCVACRTVVDTAVSCLMVVVMCGLREHGQLAARPVVTPGSAVATGTPARRPRSVTRADRRCAAMGTAIGPPADRPHPRATCRWAPRCRAARGSASRVRA
jgi:hypothetical protein